LLRFFDRAALSHRPGRAPGRRRAGHRRPGAARARKTRPHRPGRPAGQPRPGRAARRRPEKNQPPPERHRTGCVPTRTSPLSWPARPCRGGRAPAPRGGQESHRPRL